MEIFKALAPKPAEPLVTATCMNQINQWKVTVSQAGEVCVEEGHFGKIQQTPGIPFGGSDFVQLKNAIDAAAKAPLSKLQGTMTTSFGSVCGSLVASSFSGQPVVLKDVARGNVGTPDVIQVRDVPETENVFKLLQKHVPPVIEFTDSSGTVTKQAPGFIPMANHEG